MKPEIEGKPENYVKARQERRPRRRGQFNVYRALIVTIVTAFLAAVTYVVSTAFMRSNPTFNPRKHLIEFHQTMKNPGQLAFGQQDQILILCLGLDENRDFKGIGHTKGSRTDTIFILNLDKKAKRLGILSIPRDTYIYRGEKWGYGKVNAAYAEAFWEEYDKSGNDYEKAKMAGVIAARKTISEFLGIDVDYYVLIKIKASREVVDAIGGITVDVEKDMDYDDSWGKLHIHLKRGRQKLNGAQAVGYARYRHDEEGDWGRIRRQQQVIQALARELKKPVHIMHISKLAKIIKNNMDTNLELGQIIDIAHVYKNFNPKNVVKGVISGYDDWAGGGMVIVPHELETKRLVRRILKSSLQVVPEEIRVRVWNKDASREQLNWVADKLRSDGYKVMEVSYITWPPDPGPMPTPSPSSTDTTSPANTPTPEGTATPGQSPSPSETLTSTPMPIPVEPPYPGTEIIDHYGNEKGRQMLEYSVKFYKARVSKKPCDNREAPSDFTIILAKDYYQMPDDPSYTPPPPPRIEGDSPGTFKVHEIPGTSPAPTATAPPREDGKMLPAPSPTVTGNY